MRRLDILIREVGASTCDHICVENWANTFREGRVLRQEQFAKARLNIEWRGTAMVTKCDVNGIFPQLVQRDFGAVSKCILIIEDAGCLRRTSESLCARGQRFGWSNVPDEICERFGD